jgi:hypothetical protein
VLALLVVIVLLAWHWGKHPPGEQGAAKDSVVLSANLHPSATRPEAPETGKSPAPRKQGNMQRKDPLPDFSRRDAPAAQRTPRQQAVLEALRKKVPGITVDFDPLSGSPGNMVATGGFLSNVVQDRNDPGAPVKEFLNENADLFGYDSGALRQTRITREDVSAQSGMHTTVWQQEVDGIPVYKTILRANVTKDGALVALGSHFLRDAAAATGMDAGHRAALVAQPPITVNKAVSLAAANLGDLVAPEQAMVASATNGQERKQQFNAPQLSDIVAQLSWLPMRATTARLAWDVTLMSLKQNKMFRILVDAQTGEVLMRTSLTNDISDASFRVYADATTLQPFDSPSPMSPGLSTPSSAQPPTVSRNLITTAGLDTSASPNGWINDGGIDTYGNNVDAHLDTGSTNPTYGTGTHATSATRVFDFTLDPTQAPATYQSAAVTQLFYACNYYHDRLYALGFTESAGNFQQNNFGRGGIGNDAVLADAQDGGDTDNADFSTPPDGSPGRMQMYIFTGPTPDRDGDLDMEVVFHEHTHGLSNRLVGGGVGISALQPSGMGEGWSDFYALCLLSQPGDDVNGNYASGGYVSYQLSGLTQPYYYGIRRYPYTTDMAKNPLTLKDVDSSLASAHSSVPLSPLFSSSNGDPSEVHNQGEVWCVTLWDARANLVNKLGAAAGNQMILQLVTDGMKLSPADPTFLQARDAIIQADLVDNAGANKNELWAAFAKRGMGSSASVPSNSTTTGVVESYDIPDNLSVTPSVAFSSKGQVGGPFSPSSQSYTLTNSGAASLNWTASVNQTWLSISSASGTLAAGASTTVTVAFNSGAASLAAGHYSGTVNFIDASSGAQLPRTINFAVGQIDYFTEIFTTGNDTSNQSWLFTPDGSANYYSVRHTPATAFPSDPTGGTSLALSDDNYIQVTPVGSVSLYGTSYTSFYVGSNGYITFGSGDSVYSESLANHFNRPRISALFDDLYPGSAGTVTWRQLTDRIAVTYQNVTEFGTSDSNNFQIEMFFDGRVRITCLGIAAKDGMIGLSQGLGAPADFASSDFSAYPTQLPLQLAVPAMASEGDGVLAGQGVVTLPAMQATDALVSLTSANTSAVTVPATVTIPAGQLSSTFDITIVDDAVLNGTRNVLITAGASGYANGSATLAVNDNETATLAVSAPASATEGIGSVQGTVTVSTAPTSAFTVSLTSSDMTAVTVPSTVLIPAGQTSATFTITIVDDNKIDGTQSAIITAHVANWTDGSATINVLDNESTNLSLSLPSTVAEGATGTGTVTISGTLTTALTVSLSSDNTSRLTVPASVQIPAGSTSAAFTLTAPDNALTDGDTSVTVAASATGFTGAGGTTSVLDNDVHHFTVSAIATSQARGAPFSVTITAKNANGETIGSYTGTPALTGSGAGGTDSITPTATTAFSNGVWTGNVTVNSIDSNVVLTVNDGAGHTGTSNAFNVAVGPLHHFSWSTVASPQIVNTAFNTTVTAQDCVNNTVTDFAGTANLSGFTGDSTSQTLLNSPAYSNSANGGTYTLGYSFTPSSNIQVTAVRSFSGTKVSIWTNAGVLLTSVPITATPGSWTDTPLTSPLQLLAGTTYRIGFLSGGTPYYWRTDMSSAFPNGTITQGNYISGDAFPSSSSTTQWWFVDLKYTVTPTSQVAVNPITTGAFSSGIWTGNVSVSHVATQMKLHADDGSGHTGDSGVFNVQTLGPLSLGLPAGATEGDAPVTATVSLPAPTASDLTVNLVSSDTSEATVPATVTIPSGQSSATFPVTILNDTELDGKQNTTITVTAAGYDSASAVISVYDNETATFAVTAPSSASEGVGTVQGTVTVSTAPTSAFTVSLTSSDVTAATVPPTVVIPAGQTSATFTITIINDTKIDGTQTATITAHVAGWTDGMATISVLDNENTYIILSSPIGLTEGATSSGAVTISGTLTYPLTVFLSSNNTPRLAVPASVTIPAGSTSATFQVTAPDNTLTDGSANVIITPSATGFTGISRSIIVADNDVHHFTVSSVATSQVRGAPFSVTLTAKDVNGTTISSYTGTPTLSAVGTGGTDSITPTATTAFSSGVWTGNITVNSIDNNVILTVNDGAGHTGASNAFNVGVGSLHHFAWSTVASPQIANSAFNTTITAQDIANNTVAGFTGAATLSCGNPPRSVGTGTSSSSTLPFYTRYHDQRSQCIYLQNEVGSAGTIRGLSLNVTTLPGQTLNNWTIRIKHTSLSGYSTAAWESTGWTTVYQSNQTISTTGLVTFTFSTPFVYDGASNLMVDYSFNNSSYSSGSGAVVSTTTSSTRSIYYYTNSGYGDPLTWSGTSSPTPTTTTVVPNMQLQMDQTIPITPPVTGSFANGIWTGAIAVQQGAIAVNLRADDGSGHAGESNAFDVAGNPPAATTLAATAVSSAGVTLNGAVNANVSSTTTSFDYGLTASYGTTVTGTPSSVTGSNNTAVSAALSGLTPAATYHFRFNGANSYGTTHGNDMTFATLSDNANLSNLVLSAGTLSPVFASGTTNYSASVPNSTSSITVTPTVAAYPAAVKVNGVTVVSSTPSGAISLSIGANTVTTVVTAPDGITTKTYTATITRAGALVLTDGAMSVTVDGTSGAIYNATYSGHEFFREGTYVSDWGLQIGTDTTTFRKNTANSEAGIPITVIGNAAGGSYTAGGANVAVTRSYQAVAGAESLRITNTFVNNGASAVTLRYFDTLDPDQGYSINSTYTTANDVLLVGGRPVAQATISPSPQLTCLLTGTGIVPVLSAGGSYFQIDSGSTLNTVFSAPADDNGAISDNGLDLIAQQTIPPGGTWTFQVLLSFGASVTSAQSHLMLAYPPPEAATLAATEVTGNSATLNGTVNANGNSTAVSFDYGNNISYGANVAGTPTPVTGIGNTATGTVLTGLTPGTTYHFRVKGVNNIGTTNGNDQAFTTTPSSDASLSGFAINAGTLSPVFAGGTTSYSASVSNATGTITITPTVVYSAATVKVSGVTVASGSTSGAMNLTVGSNTIDTVVTAQDGLTRRTYTLVATRRTSYQDWAVGLGLSGVAMDPAGDSDHDGVKNIVEWAFGTNPAMSSLRAIHVSGGVLDVHGGPTMLSVRNLWGGLNRFALFGRRKDAAAVGLTYAVEFSADLTDWTGSAAAPTVIAQDSEIEAVTVPFPALVNGLPPHFFRIKVAGQ